jgi:hypothetical protein
VLVGLRWTSTSPGMPQDLAVTFVGTTERRRHQPLSMSTALTALSPWRRQEEGSAMRLTGAIATFCLALIPA